MSRRTGYVQVNFSQGILDGVDIDNTESQSLISVSWLENFDHTKIEGALVKRDGWRLLYDDPTSDYDFIDSPHEPGIKLNATYVQPFSTLVTLETGDFCSYWQTYRTNEENQILALGHTRHPVVDSSNAAPLVFTRYYRTASEINEIEVNTNGTLIVAYTKEKGQTSRTWQNALVNSYSGAKHPYPGWMPRGILTDWTRFGGTVIFGTQLNNQFLPTDTAKYRTGTELPTTSPGVSENMYPVYVYQYHDTSFKRDKGNENFWNVIAWPNTAAIPPFDDLVGLYDLDNKYSTFKVRYPSTWLTRNDVFDVVEVGNPDDIFSGQVKDIELCIGEHQIGTWSSDPGDWATKKGTGSRFEGYYKPIDYPYDDHPYFERDYAFVESLETLNNITVTLIEQQSTFKTLLEGMNGSPPIRVWRQVETQAKYANRTWYVEWISANLPAAPRNYTINNNTVNHIMFAPTDDRHPNWNKEAYMVLGTRLPDYLENGKPRYWMKGEKIPLVITAVVNGIELFIMDYTYEVKTEPYMPNPQIWNLFSQQDMWKTNIGTGETIWESTVDDSPIVYYNARKLADDDNYWRHESISRLFYGNLDAQITADGDMVMVPPVQYVTGNTSIKIDAEFYTYAEMVTFAATNWVAPADEGKYVHVIKDDAFYKTSWNGAAWGFVKVNPGDIPGADTWFGALGYQTYKSGIPEYIPHCWEPFNPSQQPPYTQSLDKPTFDFGYSYNHGDTDSGIGHRPYLTRGNVVFIQLRLKNEIIDTLYEMGLSEIKVYCSKPDMENSLLRSQGIFAFNKDIPAGFYGLPVSEYWDNNPNDYGLVRTFRFDGKPKGFADLDDYEKWKEYDGSPTVSAGWITDGFNTYSWPTNKDGSFNTPASVLPATVPGYYWSYPLLPDSYLWDYPITAPTLTLNSDGNYWQGRSARCVEQIKGRVFIGGCIDDKGHEEPGIVRYTAVQGGVLSLDVFNEADFVQFGAAPITALQEYREQLWVFTREDMYRLQMPSITDILSWELLEKISGQGAFGPKAVKKTPYGVVWINETGLWISDGRIPERLSRVVDPHYQWIATLRPDPLVRSVRLPAVPVERGFNPYLSLDYKSEEDELVISTPTLSPLTPPTDSLDSTPLTSDHNLTGELRLIFDFKSKTWRAETTTFPEFGQPVTRETYLFGP